MALAGVGYLVANDILTDAAFALIEPSVNVTFPTNTPTGLQDVPIFDPAMYVGASIVVGVGASLEVVVISAVDPTVGSFAANFTIAHSVGEPITGATFPVQQPLDPFFTQQEMLGYLANAQNDFLDDCPLVIAVTESVTVTPTAQITSLPADCMKPVRVGAYGVPLRETSQSNLDAVNYRWQLEASTGPIAYFRDKVGLQKMGIYPRANNVTTLEIVYEQRGPQVLGLADGFLIPDPFLLYILFRVLEFAYSKDGEQRNPGLAKYYAGRYATGIKVCNMFLEAIMDPNLEMAQ